MNQICQFCFQQRNISDLMLGKIKIKLYVLKEEKLIREETESENYYCRDKNCYESAKLVE